MSLVVGVIGPPGMERDAIRKSVEITGEYQALVAGNLKELLRRKLDASRIACLLQMFGADDLKLPARNSSHASLLRMLVETSDVPDSWLIEGLKQGAIAVIAWPCLATELTAALKAAKAGSAFLTPRIGGLLVGGIRNDLPERLLALVLTRRERQVARLLRSGRTNKEIGQKLGIAESTVECHLTSIYRKLGVQSRAEAA
jgi:DNA-binding NarL/FixJ family response regulator